MYNPHVAITIGMHGSPSIAIIRVTCDGYYRTIITVIYVMSKRVIKTVTYKHTINHLRGSYVAVISVRYREPYTPITAVKYGSPYVSFLTVINGRPRVHLSYLWPIYPLQY